MRELSNPGASGSVFYISDNDDFLVKTVQHSEAEFLQKLLPGYFMVSSPLKHTSSHFPLSLSNSSNHLSLLFQNLNQNPYTLLPKFYGLYCYQVSSAHIVIIMLLFGISRLRCNFVIKRFPIKL